MTSFATGQAGNFRVYLPHREEGSLASFAFLVALSPEGTTPRSISVVFSKQQLRDQYLNLLQFYPLAHRTDRTVELRQFNDTLLVEREAPRPILHVTRNAGVCLGESLMLYFDHYPASRNFLRNLPAKVKKDWGKTMSVIVHELPENLLADGPPPNLVVCADECVFVAASQQHLAEMLETNLSPNMAKRNKEKIAAIPGLPDHAPGDEEFQSFGGSPGKHLSDALHLWQRRNEFRASLPPPRPKN